MDLGELAEKIMGFEDHILDQNFDGILNGIIYLRMISYGNSGISGIEGALSEHLEHKVRGIEALRRENDFENAGLEVSELRGFVDGVRFVYEPSTMEQISRTMSGKAKDGEAFLNEEELEKLKYVNRYFLGFATGVELSLDPQTEKYGFRLMVKDNPEDVYQGFKFNPDDDYVKIDNIEKGLDEPEKKLLIYLIDNNNAKLSRQQIIKGTWKGTYNSESYFYRTMNRLRKKIQGNPLGPHFILSIGGEDYRFSIRLDMIFPPEVEYKPESGDYISGGVKIELGDNKPRQILDEIRKNGSDGATRRELVDELWSPRANISVLNVPLSSLRKTFSDANPYQPCPLYSDGQSLKVVGF